MYRSTSEKTKPKNVSCDECGSNLMRYVRGAIICSNCDKEIYKPTRKNKYNAVKTVARDGQKRDSKFEASVADELYMLKSVGEIFDYDSQYKVELPIYNRAGEVVMKKNWKVDFRRHNLDGSFTLLEAKGKEGVDYKWKRDLLVNVWLPEHPEYDYEVRTMKNFNPYKSKKNA